MRDARLEGRWHRSGPVAAFGLLLAVTATNQGCSCNDDTANNPTTSGSPAGSGGAGGTGVGGSGGSGGNNGDFTIAQVANGAEFHSPFDAAMDPEGITVYFTGVNPGGEAAVFSAPAAGGAVTQVAAGGPLVSPFGIAASTDGQQLFVADVGAQNSDDDDAGLILVVPVAGGAPTVLVGGDSTKPASLEVLDEAGQNQIYFTGRDKTDGKAGVFKISAAGAAGGPSAISKDPQFRDPSGIAVAADNTIYVADTIAGTDVSTTIWVVDVEGGIKSFATGLAVGYPAGLALTNDATQLLVSGLDPATRSDVIFVYDVADATTVTKVAFPATIPVDTFFEPAGMHGAKNADVFAWVDSRANATGTVFVVSR